ncbi:hypothetical protein [Streptomyces endocoffeicus]|uniref:hypothetical protein n=1 Tax=Streptomyces endocoffeicus TaxID=2898945 RepID=UPI003FD8846C
MTIWPWADLATTIARHSRTGRLKLKWWLHARGPLARRGHEASPVNDPAGRTTGPRQPQWDAISASASSRPVRVDLHQHCDREKDVEILVLRHQLPVLQRQVGKPTFTDTDRAILAGLLYHLPKDRLRHLLLLVRPDTVLRRHRDLLRRRHAATCGPNRWRGLPLAPNPDTTKAAPATCGNGLRPAKTLVGATGFEPASP